MGAQAADKRRRPASTMELTATPRETGNDGGIAFSDITARQEARDAAELAGISRELGNEYGGLA